jgi:hypothetical protein
MISRITRLRCGCALVNSFTSSSRLRGFLLSRSRCGEPGGVHCSRGRAEAVAAVAVVVERVVGWWRRGRGASPEQEVREVDQVVMCSYRWSI